MPNVYRQILTLSSPTLDLLWNNLLRSALDKVRRSDAASLCCQLLRRWTWASY